MKVSLAKKLTQESLDALLITSVPNIIYLTGYGGFSTEEREAFVLLTKNKQYIFTDGRYTTAVKEFVKGFTLLEISSQKRFKDLLLETAQNVKIKRLGFESHNLTVAEYTQITKSVPGVKFIPTNGIIESIRIIKSNQEIESIEQACAIGDKAFAHILSFIKKGVSEKELAFKLEIFIKEHGVDLSFSTIVAFGKNAAVPHHQTGETRLAIGDFALFDFGVKVDNYCSDMTRTVVFGKAFAEQKKMYNTVLEAQKKALEQLSNAAMKQSKNIKASDVDKAARQYILDQGYQTIPHSLGHGIGLEVHEIPHLSPYSEEKLKPGMVFSIEPGIYIPDFVGVRIEDLVVIEKSGPRLLTHALKNKLIEI